MWCLSLWCGRRGSCRGGGCSRWLKCEVVVEPDINGDGNGNVIGIGDSNGSGGAPIADDVMWCW